MSTAVAEKPGNSAAPAKAVPAELIVTYTPLGETESITLSPSKVSQYLVTPTRSGKYPTKEQVVKFIMLCKAQGLNPWLNDAYLVGYDSNDGPSFSLITAIQAMLKRAEASPQYNGMEQGVIVLRGDVLTERKGDLLLPGETLIGGWARVHRKDRDIPSYDAVNLTTFDTGKSRWAKDKAGMIVKCAMASALRTAYPSTLAAMYCKEEMELARENGDGVPHVDTRSKGDRLAERLTLQTTKTPEAETSSEPHAETLESDRQTETLLELQGDDRRQMEPVGRSQPKGKGQKQMDLGGDQSRLAGHDVAFFLKAVSDAKTVDALDEIKGAAQDAWSDGSVDGDDVKQIEAAITKRLATI